MKKIDYAYEIAKKYVASSQYHSLIILNEYAKHKKCDFDLFNWFCDFIKYKEPYKVKSNLPYYRKSVRAYNYYMDKMKEA